MLVCVPSFLNLFVGGAGMLRLMNSDGTFSEISTLGNQNIRVLNSDISNLGSQNIRVLNSDMSNLGNQNIRVLNSDGTFSPLPDSIGQNIRFVTSDGSMVNFSILLNTQYPILKYLPQVVNLELIVN